MAVKATKIGVQISGEAEIICADAIAWLDARRDQGAVITSLPDAAEIGLSPAAWEKWFIRAAGLCMGAATPSAPAIFYQTDRKADGRLYSKADLLYRAAAGASLRPLWHKIVLRRRPGAVDIHRPGYTHLVAFSAKARPGKASADVIERGAMVYPNAMGLAAAEFAIRFCGSGAGILDPFCGKGTVPQLAAAMGRRAIGIDIDPDQCAAARKLTFRRP